MIGLQIYQLFIVYHFASAVICAIFFGVFICTLFITRES